MTDIVKLIPLIPLLAALVVIVRAGVKAMKADPMTDDDKDVRNEAIKGAAYIFAAASLLWWFTPGFDLGLTILWTALTLIFGVVVVLTVIELPNKPKWNKRHDWLWKEGRKTPGYSRSDEPVERIRWYRRIMLVVLVLTAILCGVYAAVFGTTSSSASDQDAGSDHVVTAPADPTTSTPSAGTPTSPSTSAPAAPATFKNECGGLDPKKVNDPNAEIDFGTGLDETGKPRLWVCNDGDWAQWSEISSDPAPAKAKLTYWITNPDNKNEGYGVVVIKDKPYLFWATKVQWN